jgi:hypothetical protein
MRADIKDAADPEVTADVPEIVRDLQDLVTHAFCHLCKSLFLKSEQAAELKWQAKPDDGGIGRPGENADSWAQL